MSAPKGNVFVVLYTVYHHVYKLGLEVHKGLLSTGVNSKMFQVQETLSEDILKKIGAPPRPDLPIIRPEQLTEADGILFGFPTRFGMVSSQMKGLLDGTGALWARGDLHGKFAGTFFSTGSSHGGQESNALTLMPFFAHHGMRFVPFGYRSPHLANVEDVLGGSPWGSGTLAAGNNKREVDPRELEMAYIQGQDFGELIQDYVAGKHAREQQKQQQSKL
ncbi:unnamed protein product [Cunninghamella blakesleeana]